MEVWITKWALTKGIAKRSDAVSVSLSVSLSGNVCHIGSEPYYGNEWHKTEELAIEQAERMRLGEIESLKKLIVKLEGMRFEPC